MHVKLLRSYEGGKAMAATLLVKKARSKGTTAKRLVPLVLKKPKICQKPPKTTIAKTYKDSIKKAGPSSVERSSV